MKGQIEWALIGPIVTVGMVMVIIIPIIFLRVHLMEWVKYEFNYNNAQLTLLTLVSSTYEKRIVSEIISEHLVLKNNPDIGKILSSKLDKIVPSKCYKLTASDITLVESSCKASKYFASTKIVFPFNGKEVGTDLELVID
jgi:hypothetical protein